jgi:hypothetical protein
MQTLNALPPLRPAEAALAPSPPAPLRAETVAPAPAAPAAESDVPVSALPNLNLRLDASLGLVVLEFRNTAGELRTIPSQRELDAYRDATRGVAAATPDQSRGPAAKTVGAEPPRTEPARPPYQETVEAD